jgi:hypothetical protein
VRIVKTDAVSASERTYVTYMRDSSKWRDVTSSAANKNKGAKTFEDALSAGSVSLPRDPQLSADFMIDRNVMSQASTAPGTSKTGNNIAVTADNGFTAV